ncbi:MAG: class I SAM-dependent methyltransferase [Dongiaceae bacterium]
MPIALAAIGRPAALIHADLGTGEPAASMALARAIMPMLIGLLAPVGIIAGDQPMPDRRLDPLPLPSEIAAGRYYLYRAVGGQPVTPGRRSPAHGRMARPSRAPRATRPRRAATAPARA